MPQHRAADIPVIGVSYRIPHEPRHRDGVTYADAQRDFTRTLSDAVWSEFHAVADRELRAGYTDGYGNPYPDDDTFVAKFTEAYGHAPADVVEHSHGVFDFAALRERNRRLHRDGLAGEQRYRPDAP